MTEQAFVDFISILPYTPKAQPTLYLLKRGLSGKKECEIYDRLLYFVPLRNEWRLAYTFRIDNALFSAASIISRSPGPLSLMPHR
ncbi:hypothetical protein [Bacteroides sp. AN502(2024)]|uniref:hypothetical protein n=1 Tax=Bacteroides sp. AN502(2024) TaxID=3160599 RepID=UPI003517F2C9